MDAVQADSETRWSHRQGPGCGSPELVENQSLPRCARCTSQEHSFFFFFFCKVEIVFPLNFLGLCVFGCLCLLLAFPCSIFSQVELCLLFTPRCIVGICSDWGNCFLLSQHSYRQMMAGGAATWVGTLTRIWACSTWTSLQTCADCSQPILLCTLEGPWVELDY